MRIYMNKYKILDLFTFDWFDWFIDSFLNLMILYKNSFSISKSFKSYTTPHISSLTHKQKKQKMSNQNIFEAAEKGNLDRVKDLIEKENINIESKHNVINKQNFIWIKLFIF